MKFMRLYLERLSSKLPLTMRLRKFFSLCRFSWMLARLLELIYMCRTRSGISAGSSSSTLKCS
ncbi:hypothetical protein C4D60_Mb06t23620 [Musa balbisiana]|uniref:Uncharacterized protein n=1 Tax=Musa balbisiana TaxID=52838 RepID=A0A4S8ISP2_MUSBA|nr:hypothetical protein C4D60_Mb06t23620 [Musa balbisiana]